MIRSFLRKKASLIVKGIIGLFIDHLKEPPPILNFVEEKIIGKTVNNIPISYYLIGSGKNKVLFVSAIHGNEAGTVKLARYLIKWLNSKEDFKKKFTFYVIPCLNIDGYRQALKYPDYFNGGRIGRFNVNNVDLNRNFNTPSFQRESVWSFGRNYQEKEKTFCGEYRNSEPETQALTEFIKSNTIKVAYFFHNAGKDVMGNNVELSKTLTKIYSDKTGFRLVSDHEWVIMRQTGTSKEWCEINGVAYIEVEGSSRWGSDWKKQKPAIEASLQYLDQIYARC